MRSFRAFIISLVLPVLGCACGGLSSGGSSSTGSVLVVGDDAGSEDSGTPSDAGAAAHAGARPHLDGGTVAGGSGHPHDGRVPLPDWSRDFCGQDRGFNCPGFFPRASHEQLCAAPRKDGDAERLAMELSGAFMAPDDLYEEISSDLARIRAVMPATANVHQFPSYWPGVSVGFLPDSGVDVLSYSGWNCLNAYYGARMSHWFKSINSVAFDFDPWIDTRQLAADYAKLPQVRYAVSNMLIGDGADICVVNEGDARVYIFDEASGDCSAGCTVSNYYAAKVGADGGVTVLGEWRSEDGGWTLPAWFTSRTACTKNL